MVYSISITEYVRIELQTLILQIGSTLSMVVFSLNGRRGWRSKKAWMDVSDVLLARIPFSFFGCWHFLSGFLSDCPFFVYAFTKVVRIDEVEVAAPSTTIGTTTHTCTKRHVLLWRAKWIFSQKGSCTKLVQWPRYWLIFFQKYLVLHIQ